ncbi:general secretion pathway protein L [Pseudomonas gessardii]|jgi:general secretion pathway protein L|uniref:type II secretion system protein GspL n=1 Tax=Pseudomonas TaxID=286 RepID=UPI00070A88DA|nr:MULTISPECIES: type II secretion system protein GspL [Pseudomonas]MBJ2293389.1 type II secretion system protein GspL [Pseudomonas sp. MF5691]MDD0980800.1 type II secretion system protein GspL [Pseudomonas shahriarae]MRU53954.1 type II secretion system protein GspL [Pseudomonas gessardii]ONH37146.1 type II secretion system protein GspL [Pseudomonas gessardii]SDQ65577.1 general secretion pathway protein L [Pseudomonas gessardii]
MTRLRIALPPLAQLSAESLVHYAWLDRAGQVSRQGQASLGQLAQPRKSLAAECFLHPRDSLLSSLELPQLPPAKVAAAVACAAQALILGPVAQMQVVHSPRQSNGQVQVGWLPTAGLEQLQRVLAQVPISLRGLYPAPYALPVPPAGHLSVACVDGHLLLRQSLHQSALHPLGPQALAELVQAGAQLHQVDEHTPARWQGVVPAWGLHGRLKRASSGGWGRALGLSALAVAVWTLGLNLYAARQVDEGQQLKARMIAQVKQAFPHLPVILNPLQQARQQLAAGQGATADPGQRFSSLLQLAGNHLPFMVGSVQALAFDQGRLHLELLPDSRSPAAPGEWQAALTEAGFAATRDEHGWTLGPLDNTGGADE